MKKALLSVAILATFLFGCTKSKNTNVTPTIDVAHTTSFIIDTNTMIWPNQGGYFLTNQVYLVDSPNLLVSGSNAKWHKVGNYYRIDAPTISGSKNYYSLSAIYSNDTDWIYGVVTGDRMIKIVNGDTVYNSMN